jgi:hypothetical protein
VPDIRTLPVSPRIKLLMAADSGAGKTALLATLANAGFNPRILDYDGNLRVINHYLKPDAPGNIKYVHLPVVSDDRATKKNRSVAMTKHILQNGWKFSDEDLGKIETWGPRDVLVFDTLTFLGQAALRGACLATGVDADDDKAIPQQTWGLAQKAVMAAVNFACAANLKCSVVFNTHLKYIEDERTGVMKCYPDVLGKALSPVIGRSFTDVWSIDVKNNGQRVIRTQSTPVLSLKSSDPGALKAEEEFDLGALFTRLIPALAQAA